TPADAIAQLADACREAWLALLLDLDLHRTAVGSPLHRSEPGWFVASAAADAPPPDPRRGGPERGTATVRWHVPAVAAAALSWWQPQLAALLAAGANGFRCVAPAALPPSAWREL